MSDSNLKFHSGSGKRRVLVIEDEAINRDILGFLIQDEYEVLFAETGAQALDILKAQHETLSLVLLDLNLPDMSGVDILRGIKADPRTAMLPVIVMTADTDAEVECLHLGATDFISKPYPQQEIILARMLRTIELYEDRSIIRSTERDPLTGLLNREYFYRYAAQFDAYHPDTVTDAAVLDINHFHILNERYGRAYCDDVLIKLGEKLREAVKGSGGIVCRREADTFLVYCPHRTDYDEILRLAANCMGEENQVRVRIGVYSEADRGMEMEQRFDRAKLAADTVKNSYSSSLAMYDDSLHAKEMFDERLMEDFHAAIREKQFSVYFQPKFDVRHAYPVLCSAEALVRWKHPELGMISPGVFIPLFEENGLIRELDSYVWRETAAQIKTWKETLGHPIPVSVNVSRIDLYDPRLQETLEGLRTEFGLSREDLLLEITESAYTEDSDQIISVVRRLRDSGFRIEMDDFGTGYSSLNMITTLPIDMLKLDMQFIRAAFKGRKDTRLLEGIIGLARSLGLSTIAEGVETAEQMFTLKSMGCDIVQGYYFSKPLPAGEFEDYVRGLDRNEARAGNAFPEAVMKGPRDRFTYEAMHDPLTGLYNHSAFDILYHDSDQEHIAVLIARVDQYGEILSAQGKSRAEQVLRRVADVLRSSFRSVDDICRLHDDEFAIIMSRMNSAMQKQVADKVGQINSMLQEEQDSQPLTLSVGVAFSDRENPKGDVLEDAGAALLKMMRMRQSGCAVY